MTSAAEKARKLCQSGRACICEMSGCFGCEFCEAITAALLAERREALEEAAKEAERGPAAIDMKAPAWRQHQTEGANYGLGVAAARIRALQSHD